MGSIKIRNPEIVEKEVKDLFKDIKTLDEALIATACQCFWDWITMRSEISVGHLRALTNTVQNGMEKGIPPEDLSDFVKKKLDSWSKKEYAN